jgi:hypothetical protein
MEGRDAAHVGKYKDIMTARVSLHHFLLIFVAQSVKCLSCAVTMSHQTFVFSFVAMSPFLIPTPDVLLECRHTLQEHATQPLCL